VILIVLRSLVRALVVEVSWPRSLPMVERRAVFLSLR
jgi:hypothetical protein